jgi:hypothetical protein
MATFLDNLREVFNQIPVKTRFLKDLGLGNCYTGFTYFVQGRKDYPAPKLMKLLTEKTGYEYILIPVKKTEEHHKLKDKLEEDFLEDVKKYLEEYKKDKGRFYLKNYGNESVTASAIEAFGDTITNDDGTELDINDLF